MAGAGKNRPPLMELVKAVILLPLNATVFIPALLVYLEGETIPGWAGGALPKAVSLFAGCLLIGLGISLAVHTASLFFKFGEGTPAPWAPPRKLVIRGAYRHVRNPMILAVLSILLGEALVPGSRYVLIWSLVFFVMNHLYFIFSEEPGLARRFGREYLVYKEKVPRWFPRFTPYEEPAHGGPDEKDRATGPFL
jgi:protein-S-isoprenylcysteine O-methyltransferase Ste14